MLLLSHISNHVIHLFFIFSFLYLNFSSSYFQKKKKLFFSLLVHTPTTVTLLPTFLFPFCIFISPLLYRYTFFLIFFYILTLLLPILFCKNLISFFHSIHIFPTRNCELSLSLSLSLGEFLFFLITLIKVDGFFF